MKSGSRSVFCPSAAATCLELLIEAWLLAWAPYTPQREAQAVLG